MAPRTPKTRDEGYTDPRQLTADLGAMIKRAMLGEVKANDVSRIANASKNWYELWLVDRKLEQHGFLPRDGVLEGRGFKAELEGQTVRLVTYDAEGNEIVTTRQLTQDEAERLAQDPDAVMREIEEASGMDPKAAWRETQDLW